MITHQSEVINALQNENQSVHKKQMQITKSNQALQESESKLAAEITLLYTYWEILTKKLCRKLSYAK